MRTITVKKLYFIIYPFIAVMKKYLVRQIIFKFSRFAKFSSKWIATDNKNE